MLRLSAHAKGRSSIILTHRALPLVIALADYNKDPALQVTNPHHIMQRTNKIFTAIRCAPLPPLVTSRGRSSTATNWRSAVCWTS